MSEMLLDRNGDALAPEGYRVIMNEVNFLDVAPDYDEGLLIRGRVLCDWAEAFFLAREISFRYSDSPIRELSAACPTLNEFQTRALVTKLGDVYSQLERPLSIAKLLRFFYPNQLWEESPSRQHAAEWLLWLVDHEVDEAVRSLVETIADEWVSQVKVPERSPYEAKNRERALAVLDSWLGLADAPDVRAYDEFPLDIPDILMGRAKKVWRLRIVESSGVYFADLVKRKVPRALKQGAARETAEYFKKHPSHLSEDAFRVLQPYLTHSEQSDLRRWLQPPHPSLVPSSASDIFAWFKNEYLPYRQWQSNVSAQADDVVQGAAIDFSNWYLDRYQAALAGDKLRTHLSFVRSAALLSTGQHVATLLLVLDGLHVADSHYLQLEIQNRVSRLTVVEDGLALAPLPTITQFCKPALLCGVAPNQISEISEIGQVLPERESPADRLKLAEPGVLYVWRVLEPDNTYHKRNNYDTLRRAIEGQLDTIAANIADIVNQVPDEIHLRIVLTTDHGRLLADSERTRPAPAGMEVHGRTAWGATNKQLDSGFLIDDGIAYLHRDSFGLPADTAVILDESAFLTSDGKGGTEHFPHGGLYPEEVIIPWLVYERDVVRPEIEITISGSGQATKPGELELHVTNLTDIDVILTRLVLSMPSKAVDIRLDWQIGPISSQRQNCPLERWPTSADIRDMKASVMTRLANGLEFDFAAKLELDSEEMYQRDDILGGLDL